VATCYCWPWVPGAVLTCPVSGPPRVASPPSRLLVAAYTNNEIEYNNTGKMLKRLKNKVEERRTKGEDYVRESLDDLELVAGFATVDCN
jgi:hypothetical protein